MLFKQCDLNSSINSNNMEVYFKEGLMKSFFKPALKTVLAAVFVSCFIGCPTSTPKQEKEFKISFAVNDTDMGTLTAKVNGEEYEAPKTLTLKQGTKISFTANNNSGYQVKNWQGITVTPPTSKTAELTVSKNEDIKVIFDNEESKKFKLEFDVVGDKTLGTLEAFIDGKKIVSGEPQEENNQIIFRATPNSGARIKAWSGTDNDEQYNKLLANEVRMYLMEDKKITVEFTKDPLPKHKIQIKTNNTKYGKIKSSIAGNDNEYDKISNNVNVGEDVTITAVPADGYKVENWTGLTNAPTPEDAETVTFKCSEPLEITVNFTSKEYAIEFEALDGRGSLTATLDGKEFKSGDKAKNGQVIQFTANPKIGYTVAQWQGTDDDTLYNQKAVYTVNHKKLPPKITVKFGSKKFIKDLNYEKTDSAAVITPPAALSKKSSPVVEEGGKRLCYIMPEDIDSMLFDFNFTDEAEAGKNDIAQVEYFWKTLNNWAKKEYYVGCEFYRSFNDDFDNKEARFRVTLKDGRSDEITVIKVNSIPKKKLQIAQISLGYPDVNNGKIITEDMLYKPLPAEIQNFEVTSAKFPVIITHKTSFGIEKIKLTVAGEKILEDASIPGGRLIKMNDSTLIEDAETLCVLEIFCDPSLPQADEYEPIKLQFYVTYKKPALKPLTGVRVTLTTNAAMTQSYTYGQFGNAELSKLTTGTEKKSVSGQKTKMTITIATDETVLEVKKDDKVINDFTFTPAQPKKAEKEIELNKGENKIEIKISKDGHETGIYTLIIDYKPLSKLLSLKVNGTECKEEGKALPSPIEIEADAPDPITITAEGETGTTAEIRKYDVLTKKWVAAAGDDFKIASGETKEFRAYISGTDFSTVYYTVKIKRK